VRPLVEPPLDAGLSRHHPALPISPFSETPESTGEIGDGTDTADGHAAATGMAAALTNGHATMPVGWAVPPGGPAAPRMPC
jgi:hypothetical protein